MASGLGLSKEREEESVMGENRVIDIKTAADILGLKANTLYKWVKYKKTIPYIDYGVSIRFYERDVIAFRNRHYTGAEKSD